jgi:hypothetical protein
MTEVVVANEIDRLRARIVELENEIATIVSTRKATLRTPAGVPVTVEVEVDNIETLSANEFLAKRIDEIDWGKSKNLGTRIINACKNHCRWTDGGYQYEPIVTVADLISIDHPGRLPGIAKKSEECMRRVLREHGLSFESTQVIK